MKACLTTAAGMLAALILAGGTVTASAQDRVMAVIERYAEACGGEALAGIKTETRTGTLTRGAQGRAPFLIKAKSPGKWLYNQVFAFGDQVSYGFDGDAAWIQDTGGIGEPGPEMRLDLMLLFDIQAPLKLVRLFPKMAIKPSGGGSGENVVLIQAETREGSQRELAFDQETGLLLRVGDLYFEDYREVGPIKRPFRIFIGADLGEDHLRMTMQLTDVSHADLVDDSLFAQPTCAAPLRESPLYTLFKDAEVSGDALDACVGVYQDPDNQEITYTVTRQEDSLMLQRTAWPIKIEIKPESEMDYFVRFLNWRFHFVKDGTGRVAYLEPGQGTTPRFEKIKSPLPLEHRKPDKERTYE